MNTGGRRGSRGEIDYPVLGPLGWRSMEIICNTETLRQFMVGPWRCRRAIRSRRQVSGRRHGGRVDAISDGTETMASWYHGTHREAGIHSVTAPACRHDSFAELSKTIGEQLKLDRQEISVVGLMNISTVKDNYCYVWKSIPRRRTRDCQLSTTNWCA